MDATILTLGGGGFSASGDPAEVTALDRFALELTGVTGRLPRVCFVPTASGDSDGYIGRFRTAFEGVAETSVLSLFNRPECPWLPMSHVGEVDLVYVGGGSTANLLAVWRRHGLDTALRDAAAGGTVLAGISAGMNCWYEGSSTDSFGSLDALADGLGFLPGSCSPHYFGEEGRQAAYQRMVQTGELPDGHAADDGVALLWRDGELVEAVTEKIGGEAFTVQRREAGVVETPLPVRLLSPGA